MGKSMYDLREMLCEELENLTAQRTNLTGEKLKAIDMLTHSIKSIDTIIAMEDAEYSRGGRGGSNDSYGRGSYARDSYARRGNDSYARRGGRGYSRDEDLRQQLEEMMQESNNKDREVIKRFMEQIGM